MRTHSDTTVLYNFLQGYSSSGSTDRLNIHLYLKVLRSNWLKCNYRSVRWV